MNISQLKSSSSLRSECTCVGPYVATGEAGVASSTYQGETESQLCPVM